MPDGTEQRATATWRIVCTAASTGLGGVAFLLSALYWRNAWTVVSRDEVTMGASYDGMALALLLIPLAILVFLGSLLAVPARWRLGPLLLHALAVTGVGVWFLCTSVHADPPELPPYETPRPVHVCGRAQSVEPSGHSAVTAYEVRLAFDPDDGKGSTVRGVLLPYDATGAARSAPLEVRDCALSLDGGFDCPPRGEVPGVRVETTRHTSMGFGSSHPASGNWADVRILEGGGYTLAAPYARSCEPRDVAQAEREHRLRFRGPPLLVREWFQETFRR